MNFFQRQREVCAVSQRLGVLFAVAVLAIVAAVDLVVVVLFPVSFTVLAWLSGLVVAGIGLTSWVRARRLRTGGGGSVARRLGGIRVAEDTTDAAPRRLRDVVEEMAVASGVPVPQVYVLPDEHGVNAFAAGFSPADAALAVTRGALERLDRDELRGVVAHEFSHVVNGDMLLNVRLMGTLFGLLAPSVAGRVLLRGRRPVAVVGLAMVALGSVGAFFARIIKAAVSRQREHLADASAVRFTRGSAGLVGALRKIEGLSHGSTLRDARAEDVSHMLFAEGFRFSTLFATHPPPARRIQLLDPMFDQRELAAPAPLPDPAARWPVDPADVVGSVGGIAPAGHPILAHVPEHLLARARHPDTVLALVFGLLTTDDSRAAQHAVLTTRLGRTLADAVEAEAGELSGLHPALRLPLAEVAFPALRHRPRPAQEAVLAAMNAQVRVDGRIGVFEYCLNRLLHRELYEAMHHVSPWRSRRRPGELTDRAVRTLLAVLAAAGEPDPRAAGLAYQAGLVRVLPGEPIPYDPPAAGPVALAEFWPVLDGLGPPEKEFLVAGMVTVIGREGEMTVSGMELLRTVCALLHCPLPPLAQTRQEQVAPDPGARS
jgi:Zn-dependent protease with chaperone function